MRGGKRAGAGRKPLTTAKRETITIRITRETREQIDELKRKGIGIGEVVSKAVNREWTAAYMQDFMSEYNVPPKVLR